MDQMGEQMANGMPPQAGPPQQPQRAVLSPEQEQGFMAWYQALAEQLGLDPNPDADGYDYRAAFLAGATPDAQGQMPPEFQGPPAVLQGKPRM